jgi:hypothetical protein
MKPQKQEYGDSPTVGSRFDTADFAEIVRVNQRKLRSNLKSQYDFIVCGSGSSGSVVAARLAEKSETRMPRIVRFLRDGGPEVLRVEDVVQHPSKGEVLLEVQAIGLNRADSMFMRGHFFERTALPARLGYEAAGVVKEVGPKVDPNWKGKSVTVIPIFSPNECGTLGEEIVVPADALTSIEELQHVLDVNFFGTVHVTQAVLPYLRQQRSGHIVNITSIAGFTAPPGYGFYAAAKYALEGMSLSLRQELAPLGIHVTLVEPGALRTAFLDESSIRYASREFTEYDSTGGKLGEKCHN